MTSRLYTILYPFISETLHLKGCPQLVFCVIFNFWLQHPDKPTHASISVIQKISGASRPSVVMAIRQLEKRGLIHADRQAGKPTLFTVTIPSETMTQFRNDYNRSAVTPFYPQGINMDTSTSKKPELQIKNKEKKINCSSLRVFTSINTGDLPEAK